MIEGSALRPLYPVEDVVSARDPVLVQDADATRMDWVSRHAAEGFAWQAQGDALRLRIFVLHALVADMSGRPEVPPKSRGEFPCWRRSLLTEAIERGTALTPTYN